MNDNTVLVMVFIAGVLCTEIETVINVVNLLNFSCNMCGKKHDFLGGHWAESVAKFSVFGLLPSRWGCRKHFVSGCWYSSGCDRGRYPRECWSSTLGVLHPGVLVIWYGHIRDLSPTAESSKGGRFPNVTGLHWLCEVGWEGSPSHFIAHTIHHQDTRACSFPSLPGPVVGEMPFATR